MQTRNIPYQGSDTGSVTLNGPAPSGGVKVQIWLDDPYVTIPSDVTVAEGDVYESFDIDWLAPGSTLLRAKVIEISGSPVVRPEMTPMEVTAAPDPDMKPVSRSTRNLKPIMTNAKNLRPIMKSAKEE